MSTPNIIVYAFDRVAKARETQPPLVRTERPQSRTHADWRGDRVASRIDSNKCVYSCASSYVTRVIAPSNSSETMTGHRHSARTPGLLGPLKSPGTFEARAQQRHILRRWPLARQKRPSFRLEEAHKCARVQTAKERRDGGRRANEKQKKRTRFEGGPGPADPEKRSRIMNILKSRKALSAGTAAAVFRSIYAPRRNVNKPRARLFIHRSSYRHARPPSSSSSLLRKHPSRPPLSSLVGSAFSEPVLSPATHTFARPLCRARCRGPINQCKIFALAGLTEGSALPSMDTKTCRQHRDTRTN